MRFRPSAAMGNASKNVQYGGCPTWLQSVAANVGVTGGKCPHCDNAIPIDSNKQNIHVSNHNIKIL